MRSRSSLADRFTPDVQIAPSNAMQDVAIRELVLLIARQSAAEFVADLDEASKVVDCDEEAL